MEKLAKNNNALVVGVSACLLGEAVRYDGGHKAHGFVTQVLQHLCAVEAICPEVGAGLGVPRPAVHLLKTGDTIRAIGREDPSLDVTDALLAFNAEKVPGLGHLSGYVFKSRSPSCGLAVEVAPLERGPGLFAAAVADAYPLLPCVDDGQLASPLLQSNFLERMVAYRRWRDFLATIPAFEDLTAFHQRNALSLLSHGRQGYKELERLTTQGADHGETAALLACYGRIYMDHVAHPPTVQQHVAALHDALSQLPASIPATRVADIKRLIADFDEGTGGLWGPLAAIKGLLRMQPALALAHQTYFHPHPLEVRFKVIL